MALTSLTVSASTHPRRSLQYSIDLGGRVSVGGTTTKRNSELTLSLIFYGQISDLSIKGGSAMHSLCLLTRCSSSFLEIRSCIPA